MDSAHVYRNSRMARIVVWRRTSHELLALEISQRHPVIASFVMPESPFISGPPSCRSNSSTWRVVDLLVIPYAAISSKLSSVFPSLVPTSKLDTPIGYAHEDVLSGAISRLRFNSTRGLMPFQEPGSTVHIMCSDGIAPTLLC